MATVLEELKVIIDGDTSGVQASFFKAARALQKLEDQTEKFERALRGETGALDKAGAAHRRLATDVEKGTAAHAQAAAGWAKQIALFQRYRAALYLVGSGLQMLYKVAEEGARSQAAEAYFVRAGRSLEDFRKATRGLISDAQLMKKANLADTMGLSANTFKNLAQIAHASAAKTGQSFDHMFDSIILGSARESRLLLDNLGIIVSVKKAKEDYAQTLKNTAQAGSEYATKTIPQIIAGLTEQQEKQAFLNAVSEAGAKVLKEQGDVGETAAERFDRFSAAIDNLKDAIGRLLSTKTGPLATLTEWITRLTDAVKDYQTYAPDWKNVMPTEVGPGDAPPSFTEHVLKPALGRALGAISPGTGAAYGAYEAQGRKGEAWAKTSDLIDTELDRLNVALIGVGGETFKLQQILDMTAPEAADLASGLGRLDQALLEPDLAGTVDRIRGLAASLEKLKGPVNDLKTTWKAVDKKQPEEEKKGAGKKEKPWWEEVDLPKNLLKKQIEDINSFAEAVDAAWYNWGEEHKKALQTEADAWREYENDLLRQQKYDQDKAMVDAADTIEGVHSVISAAMAGSASALGAAIGGFFGPLGTAIGSLIGELLDPLTPVVELLGHVASGLKGLLEKGLNPFLSTLEPLGPALEVLLNTVGVLIASALRPFIPVMNLVVAVVTMVVSVIAGLLVVLSPVVEAILGLVWGFGSLLQVVWSIIEVFAHFMGLDILALKDAMWLAAQATMDFTKIVIDAAVWLNNALVRVIRGLGRWFDEVLGSDFGMASFGKILESEDLMPAIEPIAENTDATERNTEAVQDLARDIRNLPSGYKIAYPTYQATAPVGILPRPDPGTLRAGARSLPPNFRRRT